MFNALSAETEAFHEQFEIDATALRDALGALYLRRVPRRELAAV